MNLHLSKPSHTLRAVDRTNWHLIVVMAFVGLVIVGLAFGVHWMVVRPTCEELGGHRVFVGTETYTWFQTIMVGKVPVMIPHEGVRDVYECVGAR